MLESLDGFFFEMESIVYAMSGYNLFLLENSLKSDLPFLRDGAPDKQINLQNFKLLIYVKYT